MNFGAREWLRRSALAYALTTAASTSLGIPSPKHLRKSLTATSPYLTRSLRPLHAMVCLYAVNSRTRYAYATTHTVPTSTASSFATPRLLADTVCGEGGDPPARCRRLHPTSSWRVSSIVRVSSIKTGSVNCAIAPPFRSLMGSTGNPDGISHMCMLSAGRGAGATPT